MDLPSQSTVNAIVRHGITAAGTAAAVLAAVGLVSSDDSGKIIAAIQQIGTGLEQVVTGLGTLIAIGTASYAGWTATHKSQIASVKAIPGVEVVKEGTGGVPVSIPPKV